MRDRVVKITHDVFDIADRLKEIDEGYYLVYNLTRKRYEVHHGEGEKSLQLVLPYDSLDARCVQRVRETRREYVENMLRDMDRENEKKRLQKEREEIENLHAFLESKGGKYGD